MNTNPNIKPKDNSLSGFREFLRAFGDEIHKRNKNWWISLKTGEVIERNVGEAIALIHTELSEAMEPGKVSLTDLRNISNLLDRTICEELHKHAEMLEIHRSVSKAMEGFRRGKADDKLPHRMMFEVELADAVIRIFDLSYGLKLDLAGAICEKLEYNAVRADHTLEERRKAGGKKI